MQRQTQKKNVSGGMWESRPAKNSQSIRGRGKKIFSYIAGSRIFFWLALIILWTGAVTLLFGSGTTKTEIQPQKAFFFDGYSTSVEIPNMPEYSVATNNSLTISAWINPDTLDFSTSEGTGYAQWLGKGSPGQMEWTFRIYSKGNTENRENRISFYVFNPQGGLGAGAYFQEPLIAGNWIQVAAVVENGHVRIYRNGEPQNQQEYIGQIVPQAGNAPLRIGTRDKKSFFSGQIKNIAIYSRALSDFEIKKLFENPADPPGEGLAGFWKLDEKKGSVAADSSKQGNNGFILNPVWK